jgi:uncharacterized RDD family membrane protein YckC
MGKYTPMGPNQSRSVVDTLNEAELDHWLDCPSADIALRSAAFLLDVIFFSLASSGIHHLSSAAISLHNVVSSSFSEPLGSFIPLLILYASWSVKTIAALLYFVWTVCRFAGTPAKLLLGLRIIDHSHGGHLSMGQAVRREIIGKLFFGWLMLFTLPAVSTHRGRAFQDWIANSTVKKVHG